MRLVTALTPVVLFVTLVGCASGSKMILKDPSGDDNGPGSYKYPTDPVYTAGSFDLLDLQVKDAGDTVEFRVTVNATIEDPWNSRDWGGNGFSVQMAQVYIDTDHKAGSGFTDTLPGIYATFAPDQAWDKMVLISPQGRARVTQELDQKAGPLKAGVVIPTLTNAVGRTLVAVVSKADLGSAPMASWGYQVVLQSNEGFPDGNEILSRKVNEYEGQHRFGGGTDWNCDPNIIDMLFTPASGSAAEVEGQHQALASYKCSEDDPSITANNTMVVIPMVYSATH